MNPQPVSLADELRKQLIAIQLKHKTRYEGYWAWSCSCGEGPITMRTFEECHEKTRQHWADVILALLAQHAVSEPSEWNNLKPALLQLLKDACDRDWKDETPEQIIRIAANGLYWRDQQIAKLQETPDYKNGYAAGWAEAHAAEQPKLTLTEEQVRRAINRSLQPALAREVVSIEILTALLNEVLLTSPVAPPPQQKET